MQDLEKVTNCILGMGTVGNAFYYALLSKLSPEVVFTNDLEFKQCGHPIDILHVCFGYNEKFVDNVLLWMKNYPCKELVIHSTVKAGTTKLLQKKVGVPCIFSPFRGVHSRMVKDIQKYSMLYAVNNKMDDLLYPKILEFCGLKPKFWEQNTTSLELAKVLMGTTYYGWLIIFAQRVRLIAERYNVDENKLWDFTEEIHEHLGNRPKMFSGEGIDGHCVLPNVELLDDLFLDMVFDHDKYYRKKLE